ncbi:MAG: lamin tail domain-containing protein [Nitrosopumilus sp.]|nr:lamin tail domain-containing protein [Nitrosopumilus sp.]MDH3486963.1 lamin tail domain-containing protein [Nitrosopumilus sp.]
MNSNLSLVLSLFILAGIIVPAYAQTNSDHVIINEVDINPPGNDATSVSEWVEIYNPTNSDINLGGWKIASTTVLKKTMTIPDGTVIKPGQFLTYSYQSVWFTDSNESVELRDKNGIVIDKTPLIADIQNDFKSWQRIYDGFDLDSLSDWKFATSTAGSSNGKLVETQASEEVTVTVSTDKLSYLFGQTATITGNVSKEVFIVKPFFQSQPIKVDISGPNYSQSINLYPDLNLNYKTTLNLHQVLGIKEGQFTVSVSYAGANANTNFSVGYEILEQKTKEDSSLSIITDKSQYIPGQQVSITGFASEIIPFEGMKLTVKDTQDKVVLSGNLYPTKGKFSTSLFLTTVKPVFGTYNVYAEYSDKSALTTFEVLEDIKEDVPISLWTNKIVYGLGDEVTISGRLNQVWISYLDLEIIQTKQSALKNTLGSDSGFKILDGVRILGDGTFTYKFKIPNNSQRLGDYKINVSKDIGSASMIIHVSTNPDEFVVSNTPLTVKTDKNVYELGGKIIVSGFIRDHYSSSSYTSVAPVKISISHEDGTPLEIIGSSKAGKLSTSGVSIGYVFTAIPETSGQYSLQIDVSKNIFTDGNYIIKAQYLSNTATKNFSIINPLDLKDGPIISLDKEVYGFGETVRLTGVVPPTGDNTVEIFIIRPDGTRSNFGTSIENQRFSWTWTTPISERYQNIKTDDGRDVTKSNIGVYKIRVASPPYGVDLFFKVSSNPENDSLSKTPIFVTTEKSLYKAGEKLKVVGNVIKRQQGNEGLVVPERVTIKVLDGTFPYKQIHESSVYPTQGGGFSSLFELPATIFSEGSYTVKVFYGNTKTDAVFSVVNDFTFGGDQPLSLLLSTDKSEYYPGDVVIVTGKPNKLIYLEKFEVSVAKKTGNEITCGSFICGKNSGPVTTIRPSSSGSFTYQFTIPTSTAAIGSYEATVDADFETKSIKFNVVEKPKTLKLDTIIEKENRLSENIISIFTAEKNVNDVTVAPRVISGSLITPIRGDESSVNLKISSETGICIIGSDADCLVSESTRKPGQIYDVVEVDGVSLNVRYSGSDTRLEKFSILPESSNAFLSDTNWNVEIIKDDQVSRFYYKITYKTIE